MIFTSADEAFHFLTRRISKGSDVYIATYNIYLGINSQGEDYQQGLRASAVRLFVDRAVQMGGRVRAVVSSPYENQEARPSFQVLLRNKGFKARLLACKRITDIDIRMSSMHHDKIYIVDDVAVIGSFNLVHSGMGEVGVSITSPASVLKLKRYWKAIWDSARRI